MKGREYGSINAVGGDVSSGMAEMLGSSSTQKSIMINFTSSQSANTSFKLTDSKGITIVEYSPTKTYQNIVLSSSKLINGTYNIYLNGTLYQTVTISSINTTVGSSQGGMNDQNNSPRMR